jgi:hypothetical protein
MDKSLAIKQLRQQGIQSFDPSQGHQENGVSLETSPAFPQKAKEFQGIPEGVAALESID